MSDENRPKKTEAVVFAEPGTVIVQEVELPATGPEDVRVEVEYSLISNGTERWGLLGKIHEPGKPLMTPFPHIPGYQAAGIVRQVGDKVTRVKPGDRVFSQRTLQAPDGVGLYWGGHLHHHQNHQDNLIKLPDQVSTLQAAGLLLAQVGYNGATRPHIEKDDVVVVIGDGQVGQYAGQVFRHRGAHVILSGRHANRLELARKYSADTVINSREVDFPEWINSKYPDGVAVVAETASQRELVRMATDLLKYEGQLVLLGYYPEKECLLDIHWVRRKELTIHCPNANTPARMLNTLDLLAQGVLHTEELITHTFPFRDAPKAYELILNKSTDFLGIMLDWTA